MDINEFLLAAHACELSTLTSTFGEITKKTHPAVTREKTSTPLSEVTLLLMSARAKSRSGRISSFGNSTHEGHEQLPAGDLRTKFARTYTLFGEQGEGAAAIAFSRM